MSKVAEVLLQAIPEFEYVGPDVRLLLVLVDASEAMPGPGDAILRKAQRHYPTLPGMLVAVAENGFRAYAHFETQKLLALVQLLQIRWVEQDLDADPVDDAELPF